VPRGMSPLPRACSAGRGRRSQRWREGWSRLALRP